MSKAILGAFAAAFLAGSVAQAAHADETLTYTGNAFTNSENGSTGIAGAPLAAEGSSLDLTIDLPIDSGFTGGVEGEYPCCSTETINSFNATPVGGIFTIDEAEIDSDVYFGTNWGNALVTMDLVDGLPVDWTITAQLIDAGNNGLYEGIGSSWTPGEGGLDYSELGNTIANDGSFYTPYGVVNFSSGDPGTWKIAGGAGAAPEPATWALMIAGIGLVGATMRAQRKALLPLRRLTICPTIINPLSETCLS